eukprot:gb/GECG01015051.1/.p1 GENE.gb/GECG01015051.1/~~gb/GECG01015051.1/.p1  ORF type:complete len:101 (+),score=3.60 gb/GECG01015051.1/:1-303(+)
MDLVSQQSARDMLLCHYGGARKAKVPHPTAFYATPEIKTWLSGQPGTEGHSIARRPFEAARCPQSTAPDGAWCTMSNPWRRLFDEVARQLVRHELCSEGN